MNLDLVSDEILRLTREYVEKLDSLGSDPFFREAVVKLAIKEFSWALVQDFDDKYEISEQLELMAGLVKSDDSGETSDAS